MSIKQLHNIPCPVCQRDTLHKVMVCSECGNIQKTQSEQRREAKQRVFAKKSFRLGRGRAAELASIERGQRLLAVVESESSARTNQAPALHQQRAPAAEQTVTSLRRTVNP